MGKGVAWICENFCSFGKETVKLDNLPLNTSYFLGFNFSKITLNLALAQLFLSKGLMELLKSMFKGMENIEIFYIVFI